MLFSEQVEQCFRRYIDDTLLYLSANSLTPRNLFCRVVVPSPKRKMLIHLGFASNRKILNYMNCVNRDNYMNYYAYYRVYTVMKKE